MKDMTGREWRCHSYQGVHIPGCWGCAIYDHKRCVCPTLPRGRGRPFESDHDRINRLEARVAELEAR